MAKFPEDFEPVNGYVEDPKVYTCFCQKVEKTKAVTHADYRALEEELAALRGKVGELKASLQHIADRHSEKSVDGQIVRTALKLVA